MVTACELSHEESKRGRGAVLLELYTGGVSCVKLRLGIVQTNNLIVGFTLFLFTFTYGILCYTSCKVRHGKLNHFLKVGVAEVGKVRIVLHHLLNISHGKWLVVPVVSILNLCAYALHKGIFLMLALLVLLTITDGVGVRHLCNGLLFTL